MRKYFLFLIIFVSLFYLSQSALPLDYKCDSRPNSAFGICAECASACDYIWVCTGSSLPCNPTCPAGTVFVDDGGIYTNSIYCKNLVCGDAGVASGNTCIQQSSLDSSCVNVASKTYGWTDNTAFLSCTCYDTTSATINQYTKKADGTVCQTGGKICTSGSCACPSGTSWDSVENKCKITIIPFCTATLSFPTVGTGDPCSVSATISATGCDGKSYQVKEGSTSKCSGTVSGSAFSTSCSFSQSGTKSYDLYVDSSKKDTESATCGTPPITGCSAYTGDAGNCNSAGVFASKCGS